ncbi:MAG TPA: hypothetical protein DCZ93_03360 [Elusimicrobia bacterium]|nr:hypothetical protein [Elusimicrobiota bacterium]
MQTITLSAHEKHLFQSSARIVGILNRAFNPQVLQGLERVITFSAAGTVRRRGKIRVQTKESKGGALAWAIGQRLRAARERKHLTQEALAGLTGIARANIARLEAGRHAPGLETINCMARALGLEAADLLKLPAHGSTKEDSAWLGGGMAEWSDSLEREDRKP